MFGYFQVNPDKLQNVQQKLEAFLAQEKEQKERAQRCFVSYLRSVYLMKNKEVFDAFKIKLHEYALSLGLAVAPRVRFLSKAQAQKVEKEVQEEESEEEEELRRFKAQLKGEVSREERQNSESDESSEDEDGGDEGGLDTSKTLTPSAGDADDDDDLRDLDLLTVKRKDVFNLTEDQQSPEDPENDPEKKTEKETKYKEAKKILKRKFQVNTKVTFNEEGEAVQLWPPVQQAVTAEDEGEQEEEDVSGINVEKARERLKREDQEFDKQEYSRKVKAKHREKRLKERAARKEASKRDQDEEDEVVAYLANDSEDEFDPSALPDPDKVHSSSSSSSEDEEDEMEMGSSKRQHSSEEEEEEDSEEEDEKHTAGKRRKVSDEDDEHTALDTGLSLAEDEELVLQLLGGRR